MLLQIIDAVRFRKHPRLFVQFVDVLRSYWLNLFRIYYILSSIVVL